GISTFPNTTDGIGTPSVHTGLREDVYLTLLSAADSQGRVTIGIRINTLILWLWIGGAVMALGTLLALAPRLRRAALPVADVAAPVPSDPEAPDPDPGAREEVPV